MVEGRPKKVWIAWVTRQCLCLRVNRYKGAMPPKHVTRIRKQKALARQKAEHASSIEPLVAASADHAAQSAPSRPTPAPAGKKAKRLERYLEKKLKKDESRELLARLADRKVDTSLFSSTQRLGQGKVTKREASRRALQRLENGIGLEEGERELVFQRRRAEEEEAEAEDDIEDEDEGNGAAENHTQGFGSELLVSVTTPTSNGVLPVGSGLKRPLETDETGRPVIAKRQKRGGIAKKLPVISDDHTQSDEAEEEDEWAGFSGIESQGSTDGPEDNDQSSDLSGGSDASSDAGSSDESDESLNQSPSVSDSGDDVEGDQTADRKQRSSAFKAWAHQKMNESLGYEPTPTNASIIDVPRPESFRPRPMESEPLPPELQPLPKIDRKAYSVTVNRTPEVQEARLQLPIISEEQKIMEAIHHHDVVVICGSTGSGKTTQVPQFLFEAGYGSPNSNTPGMIGITQPRRVAAVSMSRRVAEELGEHSGAVGYQIRFEGTTDSKTAVKFMTDGVLLREAAEDIALRKYSAIIIDEAHERSINTDILIGMLSRVVKLRREMASEKSDLSPLKLVIMSATLRIEDMTQNTKLFLSPPPVLDIEGRQHPVTIHFARKTQFDYVEEAFRKVSRGHKKLPPGGILVFLTGQNEIALLAKKLRAAFRGMAPANGVKVRVSASEVPLEAEDVEFGDDDRTALHDRQVDNFAEEDDIEEGAEDEDFKIPEEDPSTGPSRMHILPLFGLLPTNEQQKVFDPPPDGHRQVILATNVAETSLTIPSIRYVFDCGRAKDRQYDQATGVQSFEIGWISKASANQRSGRAGRTGPGHCYRLYSSAVYERDFPEFSEPEIRRMPIEGVVLQLKAMNLQHVRNFPFPTPPDQQSMATSEKLLKYLHALDETGRVTEFGSTMSIFPLSPRFARILLVGHTLDCLHFTIALVAALSVAEIFIPESQAIPALTKDSNSDADVITLRTNADIAAETRQAEVRRAFNAVHKTFCSLDDKSDAIKLLQVVGEFAHDPTEQWCALHFVRLKALKETQQLRRQITSLLKSNIPGFATLTFQDKLDAPSAKQVLALKQMVAVGFIDQVAIRADKAPSPPEMFRTPRRAIDVPYLPLHPLTRDDDGRALDAAERMVYIHPSSPLSHLSVNECPEYIIYARLQKPAATLSEDPDGKQKKGKTRMHSLTDISGSQLANLAKGTPLISYGKPIKETLGEGGRVRDAWVVPYLRAEDGSSGGSGWPLPVRKVKQRKVPGRGWIVE
jgi:ATP-dependent RNA helicase DHX37/DHR1